MTQPEQPLPTSRDEVARLLRSYHELDYANRELGADALAEVVDAFVNDLNGVGTVTSSINLRNTGLTDALLARLADALASNTCVKTVLFRNNSISDVGAQHLCQALMQNQHLLSLHLGNCLIADPGALAVANMLQSNSTLQELLLSCNAITGGWVRVCVCVFVFGCM